MTRKLTRRYIVEEYRDSDGYWVYLKRGWQDSDNPTCHTITENTKSGCYMHAIEPCSCEWCTNA